MPLETADMSSTTRLPSEECKSKTEYACIAESKQSTILSNASVHSVDSFHSTDKSTTIPRAVKRGSVAPYRMAVLVAGDTHDPKYDYGEMIEQFLSNERPIAASQRKSDEDNSVCDSLESDPFSFTRFYCYKGELPSLKQLTSDFDGVIISGSRFDAHSATAYIEWIADLRQLVSDVIGNSRLKVAGICFGSQLLASVLGGSIGRAEIGWTVGCEPVSVDTHKLATVFPDYESWLLDLEPLLHSTGGSQVQMNVLQLHRDRIKSLPFEAVVLGSSERCPVEAFAAAKDASTGKYRVFGIQGHPEMEAAFLGHLAEFRLAKKTFSKGVFEHASETLANSQPSAAFWRALFQRHFLKQT